MASKPKINLLISVSSCLAQLVCLSAHVISKCAPMSKRWPGLKYFLHIDFQPIG